MDGIRELFRSRKEDLINCYGCGKAYNFYEFRQNKSRSGEYCKSCQRILGHSAMKHRYTLQSKLDEIKAVLDDSN